MSGLRRDLVRVQIALDKMCPGTHITDRDGSHWWLDGWGIYWHSGHGEIRSSFEMAQLSPITEVTKGANA